jgi:dTDP-4-dehydrorhamnose 3,5-epimerase
MLVFKTKFKGILKIKNVVNKDDRGHFSEMWKRDVFEKHTKLQLVQENLSYSKEKYTLRGLHAQSRPKRQAKLVRCLKGRILDIAVDLRKESSTFLKYFKIELSEDNYTQIFIPPGFLHGFLTLEKNTIVNYMCSNYYSKKNEITVNFLDPKINIDWGVKENKIILSKKDQNAPKLNEIKDIIKYV